jgi:hypothetical protein
MRSSAICSKNLREPASKGRVLYAPIENSESPFAKRRRAFSLGAKGDDQKVICDDPEDDGRAP